MQDYRAILNDELKMRMAKNSRFTMRAFANLLELNSGSLSSILKGKRTLPRTHWQLCCDKLNLTSPKKSEFLSSLAQQFKLQPLAFEESDSEKPNTKLVAESQFVILSEWEYAAVLSLMDIAGFEFSVPNIQLYLGVDQQRAKTVFNQLLVSRLVEFGQGRWQKCMDNFKTTEDTQSRALVLGHKNELELARQKLSELSVHEREFSSITFSGAGKDLRRMKIWLRKMADDFDRQFDKKNGDQVYLFALQLFPLSKKIKKEKKIKR